MSTQRIRRILVLGATVITVTVVVAATALASAQTTSNRGRGYPPPGGIYAPFTDCPLLNPLMQESSPGNATGCIAGDATTGSITIGNITTQVTNPVTVQFGVWDPENATPNQFTGGVLPPSGGLAAQLVGAPDLIPGGLLQALGCATSTDPTVDHLCSEATRRGGKFLDVYAQAQSAGPITNFDLVSWTQPLMFHLINPLLGSSCYIGSYDNPVVVNPSLSGNLVIETDPNPTAHPDTDVLEITDGAATDNTFAAPGVQGCGPGGSANITVDEAIDTADALPAASGTNSLTLSGTFYFAACFAPADMARILLSAFRDSAGEPASSGTAAAGRRLGAVRALAGHYGIR